MAKASAADKKQKNQQTAPDEMDAESTAIIQDDASGTEAVSVEPASGPAIAEANPSGFDLNLLNAASTDAQQRLRVVGESFEEMRRGWDELASQLDRTKDEIVRLNAVELDRGRLANEADQHKATIARLETELNDSKANAAAASERAAKFEEICETIKERAFELHTALQEVKANEEKYVADLDAAKAQLADVGRLAQDEGVARVAAEERSKQLEEAMKRLEADELAARDRIAKLVEDNKTMASQVPALLMDRERWQKQFSASERENARLASERQSMAGRITALEEEIRTLRADLASLASGNSAPTNTTPGNTTSGNSQQTAESKQVQEEPLDDDLDLEASLERVFSSDMASFTDKDVKH